MSLFKYRRRATSAVWLVALLIVASAEAAARCSSPSNAPCACADGWQGPDCQYCGGKIRLVDPVGFIHDGPGNYSVAVKCSWLIEAPRSSNATIRLHIEEFATECGWDNLYIYDGDSVDSPLLAVFSGLMYQGSYGVRSVPEIITRSGSVLLHFFSDDAYNMSGFNISYAINACPSRFSTVNCSGHGICENTICTCHDGWYGKACEKPTCPGNCSFSTKQGICHPSTQTCMCNPGFGGHDCSQLMKYGIWETIERKSFIPTGSASHTATVWKDSLYIIGGESFGRSHLMYTYDFNGAVWETPHSSSTSIPNPRYGASAVIHGDKIFFYGGVVTEKFHSSNVNLQRHHARHGSPHLRNSSGHLSHALPQTSQEGAAAAETIPEFSHESFGTPITRVTGELWAFDISANTWENITVRTEPCNKSIAVCGPLQTAGHTATLVTLTDITHRKPTEKMIVIFGHSPQFGYLNVVQEYNFGTREWVIVQTGGYPVKGAYGHSAVYDKITEKIYVYGGMTSESETTHLLNSNLYSYDPTTKIWTLLANAPSARYLHTANFILPGLMMVFGGNTHNDTSNTYGAKCYSNELLSYDVLCDTWHHMNIPDDLKQNMARFGHSGTVFDGSLYLYGGFDGQMLDDMIRFTPGRCMDLGTQTECLNSHVGIKCIWNVNKAQCVNITDIYRDAISFADPDFDSHFTKCPIESRDKNTQKTLLHRERCSQQTDCTSCVQTSHSCVWCPNGVCTYKRCGTLNYHTSQRKVITKLEECPVEDAPICAQLHSCISCIGVISSSRIGGHAVTTLSTPAQLNRVHDADTPVAGSRSRLIASSPHLKPLFGNMLPNNAHQIQCYWDLETAKCRTGNSSNVLSVNNPDDRFLCGICSDYTTCSNCTMDDCIWCQNEGRCVDKNAYTTSFPYGQCREWMSERHRCRMPPVLENDVAANTGSGRINPCASYISCSSCREEPACGWCDDGSRTGLGMCLPGGATRPASPYACPHHNWHFTHCPLCQCNGHSTCLDNSQECIQPCGNLTIGQHCEKCSPGHWGNPLNGGKCQPCECNDQATLCSPDTGKCFCTTKGLAGDRCDKCDANNRYHGDPTNKGFCYYDLAVDYQFTFNLSKKEDRHFTQINFRNSPTKPDIDADFSITCSVLAKMNITIRTANGQEKTVFHSINCTTFRYRFLKTDHNFGIEDNVTLTTFFVFVYDFQPPLWIQISFSQYPKLNLKQFFITFSSCFLCLLFLAAVLWKIKQRYDMYRRRQRLFVEMEQMASRPFSQVFVEIEMRERTPDGLQNHVVANPLQQIENGNTVNIPPNAIVPTVRKRKKDSPSPIALEPCSGNKAAVLSLLVRLPTGGGCYTPPGQPAGLAVASALVTLGSPPRHNHTQDTRHTDTKLTKRGKGIGAQHPDTCI